MSYDLKITNGDLVINNGQLQPIIDSGKLIQDLLKICLTNVGALPLHPWYGSFLSRTIIGTAISTSILVQVSKTQLTTALENLQSLQNQQVKSFQRVSGDEQIGIIKNISIVRNAIDPRWFDVRISVLNKGNKPITTEFRVSTI